MTIKYGKFQMPETIELERESASKTFGRFIAEPFEKGYGHTIGNSLRRIILNSLEAPSIIGIKIEGVPHEYLAIDGIIEDMVNIILNFKGAKLRKMPTGEMGNYREMTEITTLVEVSQSDLDKNKGQVVIRLKDLIPDGNFEVINPQHVLFTVTQPMKKRITMRVSFGRGYVPSERFDIKDRSTDEILIDALYSPVSLANYTVQKTRVGQDTDFDKLIFEITTDGRISPLEALSFASQIAEKHYDVFSTLKSLKLSFDEQGEQLNINEDELMDKLCLRIDEIELSVRSTNCLAGANIETIAELVSIPERRMLEFRNFGKKSLTEIKAKLEDMGLHLGMDLSRYGITSENVRDKVRKMIEERKAAQTEEE
jgi:DNA-directed RNA polymerase subunit alpha